MEKTELTGADALVRTLADCGVSACFANPGTSEMNLVTALDSEPRIRSVLCLFEGVATGAADGFGRIAGTPAMTLLHLGAGYLNGGANIHNAKRAHTPMVNVIGDHATYHVRYPGPRRAKFYMDQISRKGRGGWHTGSGSVSGVAIGRFRACISYTSR